MCADYAPPLQISQISDDLRRNIALASGMCPDIEFGDRLDSPRAPDDPTRLTVAPSRLILGTFGPITPRLRRLSHISDAPMRNLPHAPRTCLDTEFGDLSGNPPREKPSG